MMYREYLAGIKAGDRVVGMSTAEAIVPETTELRVVSSYERFFVCVIGLKSWRFSRLTGKNLDAAGEYMPPMSILQPRTYDDFYPTPNWVTEALLASVPIRGPVWEPCCGNGAMAKVLSRAGLGVYASDLVNRGYGDICDFFACGDPPRITTEPRFQSIVTNPLYRFDGAVSLVDFARHAFMLTAPSEGQVALLVRLQWISGKQASAALTDCHLSHVVMLTKRIQWFAKDAATKNAQHHHAWIVLDHRHTKHQPAKVVFADDKRIPF